MTGIGQPIIFQQSARLIVLFHALSALVLVGACTHSSVVTIGLLRGRPRPRLARIYAVVVAAAYGATMLLGGLAYPSYRYRVRGLYLDRYAVWASNLFDIKENFASLGLPLVAGVLLLRLFADADSDRSVRPAYAVMVFLSTAIVWFDVISGLLITMERAV